MMELMFVIGIIAVLIALLLPAIQSSRESARRAQCAGNLMQLGIAMGNYTSAHSVFPPGVVNETGPIVNLPHGYHHNWAVQILPFIGQENVYRRLDIRQGVYAPANETATGVRIATFTCPSDGRSPMISYAGCHHDVDAPIAADNHGVLFLNSRVRPDDVADGLARTIMIGEMRGGGPTLGWASGTRSTLRNTGYPLNAVDPLLTKASSSVPAPVGGSRRQGGPEDFQAIEELADDDLWPIERTGGFSSWHASSSNFLFCDGSVRSVSATINRAVYQLLGNRDDGQPLSDDSF
jgi:prepilin-type processing-associated H-X9-DG protein